MLKTSIDDSISRQSWFYSDGAKYRNGIRGAAAISHSGDWRHYAIYLADVTGAARVVLVDTQT